MNSLISDNLPKSPGWYWFKPSIDSPTPTGMLRLGKWVVVLVGPEKFTRDGTPTRMVVRFPKGTYTVAELRGEWSEKLKEPR